MRYNDNIFVLMNICNVVANTLYDDTSIFYLTFCIDSDG